MTRTARPRWLLWLSGGLALMLSLALILGDGGRALATNFAALLSGRTADGTRLDNIEVLSWSHAVTSPREAGSGIATGRRQYQPLLIRKRIDKATPLLYRMMGKGDMIPSLRFTYDQGGDKSNVLTLTLTNARVLDIIDADSDGDGVTDETVTFMYEKIAYAANGVVYEDTWSSGEPAYFMAINEKGVPSKPKKQTKVSSYRTQITSPREAGSGLPTGRRQHSPVVVTVSGSDGTPELTNALLTGLRLPLVSFITYDGAGQPTGAVVLSDVYVTSMTESRRTFVMPHVLERVWGDPHVDEKDGLAVFGFEPQPLEAVYELSYHKIQWLDATGAVTHEDTWDQQR